MAEASDTLDPLPQTPAQICSCLPETSYAAEPDATGDAANPSTDSSPTIIVLDLENDTGKHW